MTTFKLAYPITHDGKEISEVTLRRAKGRDLEKIEAAEDGGGQMLGALTALAALADLPLEAVREMDAEDIADLSEKLPAFLPKGRAVTGAA